MPKEFDKPQQNDPAEPLRPETYTEILGTCARFANSPTSRRIPVDGLIAYHNAIDAGAIDPNIQDVREVVLKKGVPDELEGMQHVVTIVTLGESYVVTDEKHNGGRDLAQVFIYVEPEDEISREEEVFGKINVQVGVDDQREVTYTFDEYNPDADPDVFDVMNQEFDVWGIPRPSETSPQSGSLTDKQGRTFLRELRNLRED